MISLDYYTLNRILGTNLTIDKINNILLRFGFKIYKNNVCIPSWRHDISSINDIAEEIARVVGITRFQPQVLCLILNPIPPSKFSVNSVRSCLYNYGFNEIINDPFVLMIRSIKLIIL